MLGQKLVFGFHGKTLPEEFKNLLREYKIGNVILFLRNVESAEQLRTLCAEIQTLVQEETGYPAFIIIDQEGGMVTRLPQDAVNVPGAMALAATADPENARLASEITIRQLRGLGANFNMAPGAGCQQQSSQSGDRRAQLRRRSGGRVASLGCAAIAPYAGSGVLCCAKHFPGHGDTAVDSHLGLPRVDKTEEALEQLELIPFRRAIEAGVPAIMMSHVLFPNIEPEQVPCTMSRRMVTGLLKQKLGFRGLILTDCMEMGAIRDYYGTPEGVVASIKAGVDLAEISSAFDLELAAAKAVNEAAERGEFDVEEIRASVEKILRYKKMIAAQAEPGLCNQPEDRRAAESMARQAISQISGTPFRADENTFFCGCADYRASGAANADGSAVTFPEYMANAFGAEGFVTGKDPDEEEIRAALRQAENCEKIILGTCNGHLFRGQLALAEAWRRRESSWQWLHCATRTIYPGSPKPSGSWPPMIMPSPPSGRWRTSSAAAKPRVSVL